MSTNELLTNRNSLAAQVAEVVKYFNGRQPLEKVSTTVYRHKTNPLDFFEGTDSELSAAFKSGKSLSDFDSAVEVIDQKEVLKQMIYGSSEVILLDFNVFIKSVEAVTGSKVELKSTEKTPEQQERETAKQLIYNTATAVKKGDKTQKDLDDAIEATKVVYQKYGKTYTYKPDGRKGKGKKEIEPID
jgi:hypothetical protein